MNPTVLLVLALAVAAPALRAQEARLPNASVPALDLRRYAGDWHEIARLPMFFQRKCVADTTATYTLRADGEIDVRNACGDKDGKLVTAEGVARPVPGHPGRLQVRFMPGWLAWAPLVWADYWVIELDPDYRWAVVGGPDRKYLWILSRTPGMERALFEDLRQRAERRGYAVDRLVVAATLRE